MTVEIPEVAWSLFDEPNLAHIATLMPDGSPQSTPVWVERDGNTILFNTARGRAKTRNLERDPRVAVSVHDRNDIYRYVQVRGLAELVDEGAAEQINALSLKYRGRDYSDWFQPGMRRVTVRVTPVSVWYKPSRGD
jgi:PPOX class probable F420-dependent enzyme